MIENKSFLQMCCMAHEMFYTEDFDSEEDSVQNVYLNPMSQISFIPYQNEELCKDLSPQDHDEKAVQCEDSQPVSLLALSQMPSISTSSLDKVIVPTNKSFGILHTPKISIGYIGNSYVCKSCNISFKSGQALGGHLSKNH